GRIGGEVDDRRDLGAQHVAKAITTRQDKIRHLGEVSVFFRFSRPGLFDDLAHADLRAAAVEAAATAYYDLGPDLLAVLTPTFAAGVHLGPGGGLTARLRLGSRHNAHDQHCTRPRGADLAIHGQRSSTPR